MSNFSNELNKLYKSIDKANQLESIDVYENLSYDQKISHCIDDSFSMAIDQFENRNNELLKYMYLYGDILRYRKKTIKNNIQSAIDKYASKYPNISIEYEFIQYHSELPYSNYDIINDHEFIFEAAALVILYTLDNHGKLEEFLKILPRDENTISEAVVHPEAFDIYFSDEIICSLVSTIQNFFGYNYKDDCHYILTKSYISKDVSTLKNYDILNTAFSLMNQDEIDIMVQDFKNDFDKIQDFVFEIASYFQGRIIKNNKLLKELIGKIISNENNKNSLFNNDPFKLVNFQTLDYIDNIQELLSENNDFVNAKHLFRMALNFIYEDDTIAKEELEDFIQEKMFALEIRDPFETCFAFLYLLFKKDDTVFFTNTCMTLLKLAAEKLPWNKDFNVARNNNENENKLMEEKFAKHEKLTLEDARLNNIEFFKSCQASSEDLFKQKYNDAYRWGNIENAKDGDLVKWNLPQLVFDYTNCIMPRHLFAFKDDTNKGFELSGFKHDEVELAKLLLATYGNIGSTYTFESEIEKDNETNDSETNIEVLKESNSKKQTQISHLKAELNIVKKQNSQTKKDIENLKALNNSLNNELSQLRELVYNLQSNTFDKSNNTAVETKLPYIPNKKTLIIGGTDTWINNFKDKVENVVFISSKVKINEDLLKTADVIWLQTIALKHSDFYLISKYKEKRKISINYFSYSNIDMCLNQLMNFDKQNDQR